MIPKTMKALVAYGKHDYKLETNYPVPECGPDDILIKTEGCGICAGDLFVLVESMGVDVQRGGGLTVAEDASHRCHIRAARDHQTGGGVAEGMDIQLLRQAVLLEDQLEAVGEGGGRHGELRSLTAEQEVIIGQFPLVIGFGDVCTFLPVLPQETFHLGREVHIAVTCAGLGFLNEDLLVRHLDRVAADVDGTLFPINFMHSSMVFMSRSFQLWPLSAVWYSAPLMPRACCVGASKTGRPIS